MTTVDMVCPLPEHAASGGGGSWTDRLPLCLMSAGRGPPVTRVNGYAPLRDYAVIGN
jgi:hypothetical protein